MKKSIVSLGLVAAGAASLHAAYAPDAGDTSKIWSLSATLRGFYDDNYNTRSQKQGSSGFQVSPTFSLNLPLQQTEIGLRYNYGLYYYQERSRLGQKPYDQTHQFDLWLDHAFSPRWEARVQDTVVVAQDPGLLTPSASPTSVAQRVSGNNIVNTAKLNLHTDWTRLFSTSLSYQNTFYNYENSGATIVPATGAPPLFFAGPPPQYLYPSGSPASVSPSYAGSLNRIEQNISLDLQWNVTPITMAFIGYQLGLVNYTGNELIAYSFITYSTSPYVIGPTTSLNSNSRDNLSHSAYVGVRHQFRENLMGSVKVGAQYTDNYNDPSGSTSLAPYGDASLIYTYASGSYAQIGVTQSQNASQTVQQNSAGQLTINEESTAVYGSINHQITPKLTGSVVGHFQYSSYNRGQFNNQSSEFYNLDVDLSYAFTRHFSSDLGYNFDYYTSAVPGQEYTRNRIYLGITASY